MAPVHTPPAVRRCVSAGKSRLFRALCHAAAPDFDRQVQLGVRAHPAAHRAAGLRVGLGRGWRCANDRGAKRSRANQDRAQRVGGKAVSGRELLRTVWSLAAGVWIHTVGFQDLAVLIVLLVGLWVRLGLGLIPAGQDQLAPEVLLAVELEVGCGDVRLALQVALQLQACLDECKRKRHSKNTWVTAHSLIAAKCFCERGNPFKSCMRTSPVCFWLVEYLLNAYSGKPANFCYFCMCSNEAALIKQWKEN